MGDKAISNPGQAFGYSSLDQQYQETAPLLATATVTAGRVLALGTTAGVAQAATNGTASLCVGIAIEDATAGQTLDVIKYGYASGFAEGAIAAGDVLKRSATTAGYVAATATPGVGETLAVALAASAAGRVDMWLRRT